jgi:glutathione S-transferase
MMTAHHGGPAGHSASLLVMLAEKGLSLESRLYELARFEQHGDALLALNPAGQLPVLEDDGHALTETYFILLYLDERHPAPPLGGATPQARYAAQKWGKYVETHIAPNLAVIGWAMRTAAPDAAARAGFTRLTAERKALWEKAAAGFDAGEIAAARAAIDKAIGRVAEELAAGPWLAGADYGVADIAVFPHIARARDLSFALPAGVADWLARIGARPAVRAALAGAEDLRALATMGPERGRWG